MNTLFAAQPRRLARLALLVALVAVLRFAALDLHHALVEHVAGEHCELCLVVERGGHAVPGAAVPAAPATIACERPATEPAPPRVALAWRPLPRAPPAPIA